MYSQTTGELRTEKGILLAVGYSGFEDMRNQPEAQGAIMAGPIERGTYAIYQPRRWNQSWIMRLVPEKATARSLAQRYYLKAGPVSKGCINLPEDALATLVPIVRNGEKTLQVTI